MTLKARILGGLYGQALGDAWGMPAYFDPRMTYEKFGWIESMLAAPSDHHVHAGLPAGRITDDSEQAFSLAEAYIRHGSVNVQASVEAIVAWYDRTGGDTSLYVGPSTRRGVQALKRGVAPEVAGGWGDTNGAAMRVSVVGLIAAGDPVRAVELAHISAIPTHNTNLAVSGAAAVAAAVAVATREDATLDAIIAAGILGAELGRSKGNKWFATSVARKIEQAVAIARQGRGADPLEVLIEMHESVGAGLAIAETVGCAFGVLALTGGNLRETAIKATNLAGDADTIAAIACAIAGTLNGIDAFEASWIETLERDEIFQTYHVRDLADGIEKLATADRA